MEFLQIGFYLVALVAFIIVQAVAINQVKSMFNQKLETFKGFIITEVGQKLLEENNKLKIQLTTVKDNLELIRGQKSGFLDEKRKSIIDLNSKIELWIRTLIECSPTSIKEPINIHQQQLLDKTTTAARLYYTARSTYKLYSENQKIDQILQRLDKKINQANLDREKGIIESYSVYSRYLSQNIEGKTFSSQIELQGYKDYKQVLYNNFMELVKSDEDIFKKNHRELEDIKNELLTEFSQEIKSSFLSNN